jgi:predicted RNA binding protein YcfA (HicA-like mRNA interferase family)
MNLRRNVSADRLVRALECVGYSVHQKGNHARLRTMGPTFHSITIPLHNPLKTETLRDILADVAQRHSMTIKSLLELLYGLRP